MSNNKTPPAPPPAMPTVLKKHVAAVHTSGELSLVERKIANILHARGQLRAGHHLPGLGEGVGGDHKHQGLANGDAPQGQLQAL